MIKTGFPIKKLFLLWAAVFLCISSSGVDAKTAKAKKGQAPLNIHGFRIGMTTGEVKQLLGKKNVRGYETGFPDLFVYSPVPGTTVKLFFTCGKTANVLDRTEFSAPFTIEETENVLPKFKERLIAKYGMPMIRESQWNSLDFCWGKCGQESEGLKLEARTEPAQGNNSVLVLVLANQNLRKACEEMRHAKINRWLYEWITHVTKFRSGMNFKDAAALYQRRYRDRLMTEEEREDFSSRHSVINRVAKSYDFFEALDYDALGFEGEGPGTVVLKFTGDQAGKNSKLNRRLYYAFFSTTKFSNSRYPDVQQKLDKFTRSYGKPLTFTALPGGISAQWLQGTRQTAVTISDSGLISVEMEDPALQEAYREAAIRKLTEFNKNRFDRPLF